MPLGARDCCAGTMTWELEGLGAASVVRAVSERNPGPGAAPASPQQPGPAHPWGSAELAVTRPAAHTPSLCVACALPARLLHSCWPQRSSKSCFFFGEGKNGNSQHIPCSSPCPRAPPRLLPCLLAGTGRSISIPAWLMAKLVKGQALPPFLVLP